MSSRKKPTQPPARPSLEDQKTDVFDSGKFPRASTPPLQTISMKTPGQDRIAADAMRAEPELKRPKLRAISEMSASAIAIPQDSLGYAAPPANPAHLRARRVRDVVLVASLSIIVASIVALVIWFAAR
jgi:hypothetical protein